MRVALLRLVMATTVGAASTTVGTASPPPPPATSVEAAPCPGAPCLGRAAGLLGTGSDAATAPTGSVARAPAAARPAPRATGGLPPAATNAGARRSRRQADDPIVVASKPFGESYILAEMFARLLEARGFTVERRAGLGATEIAFGALRAGEIDVYPEYTGTGLLAILDEEPVADARAVYDRVSREFRRRWGIRWLPPLGFENTYAISVRRETAEAYGLRTLSDLARVSSELTAGFTPDFIGRPDGLAGLERAYGIHPGEVRSLLAAVKYRALASGEVDVIDGYSTDGFIARYDLVVLEDDRRFFPPYEAAALVGREMATTRPAALAALTELSGRLDEERMRRLNERVEVGGEEIARVAEDALRALGLVDADRLAGGTSGDVAASADRDPANAGDARTPTPPNDAARADPETGSAARARANEDDESFAAYLWARRDRLLRLAARHLLLVGVSLLAGILLAVPLGLALERARGGAEAAIRGVGVLQTIPGIALIAFMIPLLGIGVVPALVALFLYSLYPILRSTYTGVRDADPAAVDAAESLGMTPGQVLRHVRLPLAAPVVMAGVRTAAVIGVGTATLAAFIGAGGLGDPIVAGLALSDTRMILSGAIPAALLALAVDLALGAVEWAITRRR